MTKLLLFTGAIAAVLATAGTGRAVLVAQYDFDDQSMLGLDSAGGDNNGVQQGADSSYSTTSRVGSGSLYVDSTGAGLRVENSEDFQPLTTFTIASFVRPDTAFSSLGRVFGALGIDGQGGTQFGTNTGYGFGLWSDGTLRYTTYGIQDYDLSYTEMTDPPLPGSWSHIAVTVTGGNAEFYVNGEFVGAIAPTGNADPAPTMNPYHIGASAIGDTDPFRGLIDDLRVYDEVLDASAIASLAAPADDGQQGIVFTLDRDTGAMTLQNGSDISYDITGYSLTSAEGLFQPSAWQTVTADDENWLVFSEAAGDLSEGSLTPTALAAGETIDLGNVWTQSPYEDVQAAIQLADGGTIYTPVLLTGNGGVPFERGDFDFDGDVDLADYSVLNSGMFSDLTGTPASQTYGQGDLNGDGLVNEFDFIQFKNLYLAAGGSAAALSAAAAVPEPSSMMLLTMFGAVLAGVRARIGKPLARAAALSLAVCGAFAFSAGEANAQFTPLFEYEFPASYDGSSTVVTDLSGAGNNGIATVEAGGDAFEPNENVPPGAPAGSQSINYATTYGVINTDGLSLMNNAAVAAAGGFMYDFWINPQDFNMNLRKIIDYAGTEAVSYSTSGTNGQPSLRFTMYEFDEEGNNVILNNEVQGGILTNDWNHVQYIFDTSGNSITENGSIEGRRLAIINGNVFDLGVGAKSTYGDDLARPFGIGHHPTIATEHWRGLLYNPSVYLGSPETDYQDPISLEVNTSTGEAVLAHTADDFYPDDREIDFYKITSADGAIEHTSWSSLQSQGFGSTEVANGDFNADGSVNAADYTVWRDNLGDSVTLPGDTTPGTVDESDFATWKGNFGASSPGGAAWIEAGSVDETVIGESFLTGSTLFDEGLSVTLGQIFSTTGAQDLQVFYHVVGEADLREGRVVYSGGAALASAAVPEPTGLMLAGIGAVMALVVRGRNASGWAVRLAALAAIAITSSSVNAATVDREYLLGDEPSEGASAGATIGSGNAFMLTYDTVGSSGAGDLQDLSPYELMSSGAGPVYADVSSRPLAGGGTQLGAQFDGAGDYLRGARLGLPATSQASTGASVPGPLDYTGITHRGLQFWANPLDSALGTAAQSVIADTEQHGVRISAAGNWVMRYRAADVDSGVAVSTGEGASGWSHVMLLQPNGPRAGGSVLYIDGEAIAAATGGYTATDETLLVVGANTGLLTGNDFAGGTTDFYSGIVDNLEMFVIGTSVGGVDWGDFDFATENEFAADALSGYVPGDLNGDGTVMGDGTGGSDDDVAAFIAGWGSTKLVNNIAVGDLTTRLLGDFNVDGSVNLSDWDILKNAHVDGGSLNLASLLTAAAVPEPSAIALIAVAIGLCPVVGRRTLLANRRK